MLSLIAQQSQGNPLTGALIPLVLIGGVFYFLILRPQQRRQKAQQALLSSVQVGDDVVTTSGIFGTVTGIDDEDGTVTVEIAQGIEIRLLRAGIGRRLADEDEGYEEDADDEGSEDADDAGEQQGPVQER